MENNENNHNAVQLQQFLEEYATPSEVKMIAFEYSHKAFRLIEDGVPPVESILKLVDYCQRRNELLKLAPIIEKHFPDQYHELDLNFDTPPKRTSKPRRSSDPLVSKEGEVTVIYTAQPLWHIILLLITQTILVVAGIAFMYIVIVFLFLDSLPFTSQEKQIDYVNYTFLFLFFLAFFPSIFWVIDNVTRKDLNTMDEDSFPSQQIAPSWAKKIIAERDRVGKFTSMEQVKALPISDRAKFNLGKFYRVGWLPFDYVMYAVWGIKKLGNGKSTKRRR